MGLLERIRDGTFVAGDDPPLATPGRRPTLADTGRAIQEGGDPLRAAREALDRAQRMTEAELAKLLAERPAPTGLPRADALLGAVAEHLAATRDVACPAWAQEPGRFLDRFWFASDVPGFRATAIAQTPVAFKRRGILWPGRSLRRV